MNTQGGESMTLYELQNKLGEQIDIITDKTRQPEERKKLAAMAMTVSSLAKQMINNADVVLRTEKLIAEGKLKNSVIEKIIGSNE